MLDVLRFLLERTGPCARTSCEGAPVEAPHARMPARPPFSHKNKKKLGDGFLVFGRARRGRCERADFFFSATQQIGTF